MTTVIVTFQDATEAVVTGYYASPQDPDLYPNLGEIEDDDPRYLSYANPEMTDEGLADSARVERARLLKMYDAGIIMALRILRMASTPEEESYAQSKIIELDNYAEALQDIPDQPGFPQTIVWPIAPTK